MRTLYHYNFCPFSRKIRLHLSEKQLEFKLIDEPIWEKRPELIHLNPAAKVPVLVDINGCIVCDSMVISEYLEDEYPASFVHFLGSTRAQRNEIRRLEAWFDDKFYHEVGKVFLYEKVLNRYYNNGSPSSDRLRSTYEAIDSHLDYVDFLANQRNWLAGEGLSVADFSAAAHISVLDYLTVLEWDDYPAAKSWYCRIKSRPSFAPLLKEIIPGIKAASPCYAKLDL